MSDGQWFPVLVSCGFTCAGKRLNQLAFQSYDYEVFTDYPRLTIIHI